jgi:hypothetical protein
MDATPESVQSFEQFVLLSVVELAAAGETPAHSYDVTETAKARIDDIDRAPFGGVERQEVITALASLAEAGLLAKEETESPVGKGRPAYALAVDPDAALADLAGSDDVGSYAETLSD